MWGSGHWVVVRSAGYRIVKRWVVKRCNCLEYQNVQPWPGECTGR
jgi:hypothetical protein